MKTFLFSLTFLPTATLSSTMQRQISHFISSHAVHIYFFLKMIFNSISIFYPAVQTTDIITDIAVKLWFQQSGCSSSSQEVTCPNAEGVWWVCVCELSVCEYECVYSQETLRAGRWIPNEVRAPHWRLLGWADRRMDGWVEHEALSACWCACCSVVLSHHMTGCYCWFWNCVYSSACTAYSTVYFKTKDTMIQAVPILHWNMFHLYV